jgi:DUF1680 family protein
MDGVRKPSTTDIAFQKRPGSERLNCCSVNAARGFGMISDWALMTERPAAPGGTGMLLLNWYGPGKLSATVPGGPRVEVVEETDYPREGKVDLTINPSKEMWFALKLRVPHWSHRTTVSLNGNAMQGVTAGAYYLIHRAWRAGDRVSVQFDFSPQAWVGERECAEKVSLYRGPLLLAYESAEGDPLPTIDLKRIASGPALIPSRGVVELDAPVAGDNNVRLIDYGSAGSGGKRYVTWLPARDAKPVEFSKANPSRRVPIGGQP